MKQTKIQTNKQTNKQSIQITFLRRQEHLGSPALAGCWFDEGLNRQLKALAASAHRLVFAARVLTEFRHAYGDRREAKRRVVIRDCPLADFTIYMCFRFLFFCFCLLLLGCCFVPGGCENIGGQTHKGGKHTYTYIYIYIYVDATET